MKSTAAWHLAPDAAMRSVLCSGLTGSSPVAERGVPVGDWADLRTRVSHHRLTGLLVDAVATERLVVSDAQRVEIAELEIQLTQARLWHEAQLTEICSLLTESGVDHRLLKGPALATLNYPDPQMRPTSDLDLLVRGEQIDHACVVLTEAGGRRTDPDPVAGYAAKVGKGATLAMPSGLEVDLHRLLVWGPYGVRTPTDDLWRASRPVDIAGRTWATLPLEESLLHAAYHLLVLGFRRALTIRDVLQLLAAPSLDAVRLRTLARRWGAEAILATAIDLAVTETDLADINPDLVSWARRYPASRRDRAWLRVERPEDPIGSLEAIATYVELRTAEERRLFRDATLRPEPGTWPRPRDRFARVVSRAQRSRS